MTKSPSKMSFKSDQNLLSYWQEYGNLRNVAMLKFFCSLFHDLCCLKNEAHIYYELTELIVEM